MQIGVQPPAYFYNDSEFRLMFKAFADAVAFPLPLVQALYNQAGAYISNSKFGPLAAKNITPLLLYLMTAHLLQIFNNAASGQSSGITVSATIDKISTTIQNMVTPNQWQSWLQTSEYGKQFLAILGVQSVGGFSVPGSIGRAGFRQI